MGSDSKLFRFDDIVEQIWFRDGASYEMAISPNNHFVATTTGTGSLIIRPISTSQDENVEVTEMVVPYGSDYTPFVDEFMWHIDARWLFLFSNYAGHYYVLRQINVMSADGNTQRYLTVCHLDDTCFGWLPDQR